MHPRIKARYLANLEAKRVQALDEQALLAADLRSVLIDTIGLIDRYKASKKLNVPEFIPSAYKAIQKRVEMLELDSIEHLRDAHAIRSELNIVNDLLAAHFRICHARSELASRQKRHARG
ncbi:MAG: hypothetical protein MI824_11355 [Hyphomicrobiales bacterium]|nr:hypothetical protein [Hyphomicrobiales bacterium]